MNERYMLIVLLCFNLMVATLDATGSFDTPTTADPRYMNSGIGQTQGQDYLESGAVNSEMGEESGEDFSYGRTVLESKGAVRSVYVFFTALGHILKMTFGSSAGVATIITWINVAYGILMIILVAEFIRGFRIGGGN